MCWWVDTMNVRNKYLPIMYYSNYILIDITIFCSLAQYTLNQFMIVQLICCIFVLYRQNKYYVTRAALEQNPQGKILVVNQTKLM